VVGFLAVDADVADPAAVGFNKLLRLDEHSTGTAAGVYVRTEFDTMQISGSCAIAGWQRGGNRLI